MNMKKYTITDIKAHYNDEKRRGDSKLPLYHRKIMRPLSFYITRLFLLLSISANQASVIGFIFTLMGSIMLATGIYIYMVIAVLLINIGILIDYVDGNIARYHNKPTYYGTFIDGIFGVTMYTMIPFALGVGVNNSVNKLDVLHFYPNSSIIIGMSISIFWLYRKYIITRYDKQLLILKSSNWSNPDGIDVPETLAEKNKGLSQFLRSIYKTSIVIDGNIRIPSMVLVIIKFPDLLLILYFFIAIINGVFDIIKYFLRAKRNLNKEYR